MALWMVILLGAVQGLTEFLPVSSSGHLILASSLFGINSGEENLALDLALHVGSALAVIFCYGKQIFSLFKKGNRKKLFYLAVSALPAGLVGVFLKDRVESLFSGGFLGFGFLLTAILLIFTENMARSVKTPTPFGIKTTLSMGIMQAVAVIPGLSRSGSTIFGGTLLGAEREEVADFSFLMSVPVILGGALVSATDGGFSALPPLSLVFGGVSAFAFALVALVWMRNVVKKARYYGFSVYLILLGLAVLFVQYFV